MAECWSSKCRALDSIPGTEFYFLNSPVINEPKWKQAEPLSCLGLCSEGVTGELGLWEAGLALLITSLSLLSLALLSVLLFCFSNKIELFTFFELSIPTTSSSFSTLSVGNGVEFGKSLRGTKKMEVTACCRDKVALPTLERGFQEPASQSSEGAREVTMEESRGQARVTLHPCR